MRPEEVMIDLKALQNGSLRILQRAHYFLSVPNLAIHPLHFVVVDFSPKPDISNYGNIP